MRVKHRDFTEFSGFAHVRKGFWFCGVVSCLLGCSSCWVFIAHFGVFVLVTVRCDSWLWH